MNQHCWVAVNLAEPGPCDGRLVKAHLIAKQTIRREISQNIRERRFNGSLKSLKGMNEAMDAVVWDPRVWVPMCGGPTGIGGHHGMLDHSRALKIPRDVIPVAVEEFAAEHDLTWWLTREYGPKEMAA